MTPTIFVHRQCLIASTLLTWVAAATLAASSAHAAAPQVVPLQGVLTDSGGNPLNGDHSMEFNLYPDATPSATSLWTETQTVQVTDGAFVVYLGNTQPIPLTLMRDNGDLWLGITVESDPEMARVYLGTTPFAAYAEYCGNIPGHGHDYSEITGSLSTAALPGEVVVGPQACLGSQKVTGFDGAGGVLCGPDLDNDTTYSGLDFALSGQFCLPGDKVAGVDGGGNLSCAPDADTIFTGADFATSGQGCAPGEVAIGVNFAGALLCTPQATYSNVDFAPSNQSCPPGEIATGIDANGALICIPETTYSNVDFAPSNQSCPAGQVATGIDAAGSLVCRAYAPRVIRTPDARPGCPPNPHPANTDLIAHTVTVATTATVTVTAKMIRLLTGRSDLVLYRDGAFLDQTLTYTSSPQWEAAQVSWTGTLAPGTYTMSVRSPTANVWGCGANWGWLQSVIYE